MPEEKKKTWLTQFSKDAFILKDFMLIEIEYKNDFFGWNVKYLPNIFLTFAENIQ